MNLKTIDSYVRSGSGQDHSGTNGQLFLSCASYAVDKLAALVRALINLRSPHPSSCVAGWSSGWLCSSRSVTKAPFEAKELMRSVTLSRNNSLKRIPNLNYLRAWNLVRGSHGPLLKRDLTTQTPLKNTWIGLGSASSSVSSYGTSQVRLAWSLAMAVNLILTESWGVLPSHAGKDLYHGKTQPMWISEIDEHDINPFVKIELL